MALGIIKGNKHSFKDFNLTIAEKSIGNPKKNKIKETVPYMNGSYDFSLLYGEQTYEERELSYTFNVIGHSKISLNILKIRILEWLNEGSQEPLYDDAIPGFYFLAECESVDFDEYYRDGQITAKFTAYPFKISTLQDGHDIWDDFNFELDMIQDTIFEVNGYKNITLYNNGYTGINPTVICSNDIEVTKGNSIYKFKPGEAKAWAFKLDKGLNTLTIKGTGTIEFKWCKEVL